MLAWSVCPGEETVAAYVAGLLARAERDGVDAHIDTCSVCQELVALLAKLQPARSEGADAPTIEAVTGDHEWTAGGQLGRYVLLARLGAGGMGVVYAAYDPELDRRVALKVLRRTRAGDRLRAEARAIARLAHPNVVAVHDVGTADEEVFVAMEHVDGVTVRDWLTRPRSRAEIIDVFVQVARGLAAAHRVGLVHRDVKPSNIMVGSDGRARLLDFGLARTAGAHELAGTPAYMAPEQRRGEHIDGRADQYALCVALWEALAGRRPDDGGTLDGVSDRVVRALRRGLSERPADRFATMDELVRELAPKVRRARWWIVATCVAVVACGGALAFALTRGEHTRSCAEPITREWGAPQRAAIRTAFAATKRAYAPGAATIAIGELDRWSDHWRERAIASCAAPAAVQALRGACLAGLLARLHDAVELASHADADVVAAADVIATSLPAPQRCDDVAALAAISPPAERDRAAVAALRAELDTRDTELLAGRAPALEADVRALVKRAEAIDYAPLRARAAQVAARLDKALARYDRAIASFHLAAQAAAAARDLGLLAEIWIELAQTLGNDPRTLDEAQVFDGYAASLVRDPALALQLDFARCNRNGQARDAARLAAYCEATIDAALRMAPPRTAVANAARIRLGHFQRLQGLGAQALTTLTTAVDEAERIHGPTHPDTAVARYSLGIALLEAERVDDALVQLRRSLEIRRAAFPGGNVQTAESLQGLGDALSVKGDQRESIAMLSEALAMLDALHAGDSAHAADSHILIGMAMEELDRGSEALPHYLRAADIADRSLDHRESIAAMALRLAAGIEAKRGRAAAGVSYLERALQLQERGKVPPGDLGKTQLALAQLVTDRARAHALAETARANLAAAGADLAEVDAFLKRR